MKVLKFVGPTLAALTLTATAAAPASAAGYSYDGTDPSTAAGGYCVNGSQAVATRAIRNSGGAQIGTLELRYSPSCGTNWVRVHNTIAGATALKSIERKDSPRFWETEADTVTGWSYSMQVYAPGATCVYIGGSIVGPGVVYGDTGEIRIC